VRAGVAGGAALQNLRTAMEQLSPAGQRFARFLFGLKSDFLALRNAAQGGLLPGVQRGVEALLPSLGRLESFVGRVGLALGNIFADAIEQLRGPTWGKFFQFVEDTTIPALKGIATFALNSSRGLAALFLALTPFNRQIGGGLLDLSERFAKWAEQLSTSTGYRKFLAYVAENGPRVVDLLGQVARFVERLVIAAAPVGTVVIGVFDKFLDALNAIPLPLLSLIVGAIATFATATLAASAAVRVFKAGSATWDILKLIGTRFSGLVNPAIQKFTGNTEAAAASTQTFGFALQQAADAAKASSNQFVFFQGAAGRIGDAGRAGLARLSTALTTTTGQVSVLGRATELASATMSRVGELPAQAMARYTLAVTTATGQVGLFARAQELAAGVVGRVSDISGQAMARYTVAVTTATGQVGLLARAQEFAGNVIGRSGDFGAATMERFRSATAAAAVGADRWIAAVGTGMKNAAGSAGRGISNLVGVLGGPWGIAITAATTAIGLFTAASAASKARVDDLKSAMQSYADALKSGITPSSVQAAQSALQHNKNLRDLAGTLQNAGVQTTTFVRGINGEKDARDQVVAAIDAQLAHERQRAKETFGIGDLLTKQEYQQHVNRINQLEEQRKSFVGVNAENAKTIGLTEDLNSEMQSTQEVVGNLRKAVTDSSTSVEGFETAINGVANLTNDANGKLEAFSALSGAVADAQLDASQKAGLFGQILDQLGSASEAKGPAFDALSVTFGNIATSALNAADKADLLKKNLDLLYGAAISQTEADERMARTQADLTNQLSLNSAGFDLKTAKTNADREAILQNRDALEAALLATRDKYVADIAAGIAEEDARRAHDDATVAILGQIQPTQRNSAAVQELNRQYGEIPPAKKTDITTPGLNQAIENLIEAHAIQLGLTNHWDKATIGSEIKLLENEIFGRHPSTTAGLAGGGPVPGWSPSKTADNIPLWGTAGEFMQPVDTVQFYGVDAMEALRRRRIPRELLNPATAGLVQHIRPRDGIYPGDGSFGVQFADGGLVHWPIDIPNRIQLQDINALWQQWQAQQEGKWFGPVPKNIQEIQGWLRSIDGRPYVFGAVGPNAWDCSGLVGSVYALVRGINPFVRYFSTHNEAPYFTGRPYAGVLTAGWTNPGERGPGGTGVGHTRGELAGLGFEATGSHVRVGHDLTPLNLFAHLGSMTGPGGPQRAFASGGLVKPGAERWRPKLYDSGGMVDTGWNPAFYNGWSKPEALLNPQQWDDIRQAAMRSEQGGNTYHFGFRDTDLTASKLQAMQAADAVRARDGRAR
jgi:hypothetical protein